MYINKAIIFGNITRDPETRVLPSGIKVCNFSVATNRVWKDKNGVRQDNTDFHNVVVFGKTAETAQQYLRKGSSVYVEGRMQTRSWDQDGQKKYRTEIIADSFQFGPRTGGMTGPAGQDGAASSGSGTSSGAASSARGKKPTAGAGAENTDTPPAEAMPTDTIEYPEEQISPDDIPF